MSRRLRLLFLIIFLLVTLGAGSARIRLLKEAKSMLLPMGHEAPAFSLPDVDNKIHNLDDYRGRPVYVTFWASWCAPCQQELSVIKEYMAKDTRLEDLAVLCVAVREDRVSAKGMVEKLELPFLILLDQRGEVADAYWVRRIPTSYLLDAKGRIRWRALGYREADLKRLFEGPSVLQDLLKPRAGNM
ncbi:TlpA family protein disulfide reductase [Acidobacteriota bacterium]